ncbi:MAG: hypothetical protein NVV72_04565 [Asticcacaulis sp.]|nr:hypothetical protein [Asticcacaulis sp.]
MASLPAFFGGGGGTAQRHRITGAAAIFAPDLGGFEIGGKAVLGRDPAAFDIELAPLRDQQLQVHQLVQAGIGIDPAVVTKDAPQFTAKFKHRLSIASEAKSVSGRYAPFGGKWTFAKEVPEAVDKDGLSTIRILYLPDLSGRGTAARLRGGGGVS